MCIYCGTPKYRKIYENHYGRIPKDDNGRKYEIHHIDGNRNNNDLTNLKCVSIQEHYDIHLSQGDWAAAQSIAIRMKLLPDTISKLAKAAQNKKVKDGTHHLLGGEIARAITKKRIEDGTHHWLGPASNKKRIENGTHNFLDKEQARERVLKQIEKGIHNFLNKENARKRVMNRINSGTHNFQIQVTCPHCNKSGMQVNMNRYHFDNCKLLKQRQTLTCPHCNKTGGIEGLKRWHFDNCRFKNN